MTKELFIGKPNNTAKKPLKILVGNSSNIAKEVKSIFVGNSSNQAVKVFPSFPDTYQKVEYILNTNATEYINLNIKPDSNTRSVIKFAIDNATTTSSSTRRFFGAYQPYPVYSIGYYNRGSTYTPRFDIDFGSNAGLYNAEGISEDVTYTIDFNRNGGDFYLDDTLLGTSTATFSALSTDLILFGYSNSTKPNGQATDVKYRLYHFRAYQNNMIIRDMFPCYEKENTLNVGMYDLVNGVFYANNGTGIFYKGPDVN